MSVHAIHLGNAWDRAVAAGRTARQAWRRGFGRPAGLAPGDRVFLVVERPAVSSSATLNGHELAAIVAGTPRWTCDVTAVLRDRNDLVLVADAASGGSTVAGGDPHGREPLPAAFGGVGLAIVPRGETLGGADLPSVPVPPPRRA